MESRQKRRQRQKQHTLLSEGSETSEKKRANLENQTIINRKPKRPKNKRRSSKAVPIEDDMNEARPADNEPNPQKRPKNVTSAHDH